MSKRTDSWWSGLGVVVLAFSAGCGGEPAAGQPAPRLSDLAPGTYSAAVPCRLTSADDPSAGSDFDLPLTIPVNASGVPAFSSTPASEGLRVEFDLGGLMLMGQVDEVLFDGEVTVVSSGRIAGLPGDADGTFTMEERYARAGDDLQYEATLNAVGSDAESPVVMNCAGPLPAR